MVRAGLDGEHHEDCEERSCERARVVRRGARCGVWRHDLHFLRPQIYDRRCCRCGCRWGQVAVGPHLVGVRRAGVRSTRAVTTSVAARPAMMTEEPLGFVAGRDAASTGYSAAL